MNHPNNHDQEKNLEEDPEGVKFRHRQDRHPYNCGQGTLDDGVTQTGQRVHGLVFGTGLFTGDKGVGHVSGEVHGESDADGEDDHGYGVQTDVPKSHEPIDPSSD